eukprot:CAMPEP_0194268994 /NCGR_PEP_ID=MMETSP0169-20130528/3235_1 /TAXON_ID=218684 /ORGANISM="Corethron pennatum, Strain L29A3" /LENGTH=420 /DNA_ID=CAMNT_0039010473 /DNA_START=24 /DNA_END=1283 /DNA_ORIENTATION=-
MKAYTNSIMKACIELSSLHDMDNSREYVSFGPYLSQEFEYRDTSESFSDTSAASKLRPTLVMSTDIETIASLLFTTTNSEITADGCHVRLFSDDMRLHLEKSFKLMSKDARLIAHGPVVKQTIDQFVDDANAFINSPEVRDKISTLNSYMGTYTNIASDSLKNLMKKNSSQESQNLKNIQDSFKESTGLYELDRLRSFNEQLGGLEVIAQISSTGINYGLLLSSDLNEAEELGRDAHPPNDTPPQSNTQDPDKEPFVTNDEQTSNLEQKPNLDGSDISVIAIELTTDNGPEMVDREEDQSTENIESKPEINISAPEQIGTDVSREESDIEEKISTQNGNVDEVLPTTSRIKDLPSVDGDSKVTSNGNCGSYVTLYSDVSLADDEPSKIIEETVIYSKEAEIDMVRENSGSSTLSKSTKSW